MNEQTRPHGGLAELLETAGADLVLRWGERVRQPPSAGASPSPLILEEHLDDVFARTVARLRTPQAPWTTQRRFRDGFELPGLLREYDVLRECILEQVEQRGLELSLFEVRVLSDVLAAGVSEATMAWLLRHDAQALAAAQEREREAAERHAQERREAERRLRAILETAVDGIVTCDARGRVQNINAAGVRIFGYGAEELVGRGVRRLLARQYRRGLGRVFTAPPSGEGAPDIPIEWEVRGQRKDGTQFPMELSVGEIRLPQGRLFVGTVRDISERRRAEEAQALLIETGTQLSQALDVATTLKGLATVIITHLADYCIVDLLNEDGSLRRMEVSARDAERRRLLEMGVEMDWVPGLADASPLSQAMREQKSVLVHPVTPEWLDAVARNAEHRVMLEGLGPRAVALIPLQARGHVLGLVTLAWVRPPAASIKEDMQVAQSVVERAAVAVDNARLYQKAQDAVRMREDVVAIVSHDLRNPLNAIALAASTLLRQRDGNARTADLAQRITAAAERASRLIRDLLDLTQARVGGIPIQPRSLDFHDHVRRVVDEVRLAWPSRLVHVDTGEDGLGYWDEGRLAQVVTNLVGNALQHGPEEFPVRVSTRAEVDSVTLEVHNEGPAIPSRLLPTLFEPYRRGTEGGEGGGSLGLGLFITRQIVLGHGGGISVHSRDGDGTTFIVRLPRRGNAGGRAGDAR